MTEEPFRWLEAISNRREYVLEQLKGGTPVFGASLKDGILLVGVGSGHSKVFEIFDRQALAALGHPADIEKVRQALIDATHLEAFARAPEDVSLRRIVGFGLGSQLKASFEQVYSAPYLVELLLAEVGNTPAADLFVRLHFDGGFENHLGGVRAAANSTATENAANQWLSKLVTVETPRATAAELILQAWWLAGLSGGFPATVPAESERRDGWRADVKGKTLELGWLERTSERPARYVALTPKDAGLE